MSKPRAAWPDYVCFDRLRVGEPTIAARKVEADVALEPTRGAARSFRLSFVYEEALPDPAPDVQAMARLLVAMPLLNYGLFARRIEFAFPLSPTDLDHMRVMMRETAHDIAVNRLVAPNPFLVPEFRPDPERFEAAFAEPVATLAAEPGRDEPYAGDADPNRMLVLSSGGKESLLSYGLAKESGFAVTPFFVNESGHHWFTALAAHRWFKEHVASTARVWTNIDRFYSFMNRALPFVRPDFGRLRADIYPIQLFTFQVYVTSALLHARANGIPWLVLGSEYDEDRDPRFRGVCHHGAVMDQTQWYDRAWSEYFAAKGWPSRQFSLVRPLSGFQVQGLLGHRYPELWRLQRSCHQVHERGGDFLPCGQCRKCLGILAFLLGNGLDPTRIAYGTEAVAAFPRTVAAKGVGIERAEFEHALWGMQQRGNGMLVPERVPNGWLPRRHGSVERLKFDDVNSRLDNLPPAVAARFLPFLQGVVGGSVRWSGAAWEPFDVTRAPTR